ncbi:MAG: dTMP kinase [Desulfurococcales archaeon]|nr:dTMP kinase [Desulfurococcales archaeon]
MPRLHLAFEGIDGSGLTTHSRLLVERLSKRGYRSFYSKEPTNGPIGRLIRELLASRDEPDHVMMALLFAADRRWNYYSSPNSIRGMLERGYIVVSDRYKYSSIAYQGAFAGIDWVWSINSRVPHSDAIIYIDVPVDVALRRVRERARNGAVIEAYEERAYLEKIKEAYEEVLERAANEGIIVKRVPMVESGRERPIEDVADEVFDFALSLVERI